MERNKIAVVVVLLALLVGSGMIIEKTSLFKECYTESSHSLTECIIISILY